MSNKRERISDFVRALPATGQSEENGDYYRAFFQLWNEQRYYEAHDVLEQLWLNEDDPPLARFYQGLIQAAGAFVHLQKNFEHPTHPKHSRRLQPAVRLLALASRNLEGLGEMFHDLNLAALRTLLRETSLAITSCHHATNPWSPATAPILRLNSTGDVT